MPWFALGRVNRFMSNPRKELCVAVKWILMYLRVISGVCVRYGPEEPMLNGFIDLDQSTRGYVMTYVGGAVSWPSKLLKNVALSTAQAEYVVVVEPVRNSFG